MVENRELGWSRVQVAAEEGYGQGRVEDEDEYDVYLFWPSSSPIVLSEPEQAARLYGVRPLPFLNLLSGA